ncbi:hypothetical protein KY331_04535 [Candidatus Woesearchaeota archaeon]|nr:hypothetical protein [Candidatus Woesearchaeota archaeon]
MKKILLSLIMVFCLSTISALATDTCDLEDYYAEDEEIIFNGVLLEVRDIDIADNQIDLKHLDTGEMYVMNIGSVAKRDGISIKLLDIDNSGIEPTAYLCFNVIEEEKFTPPFIIAVDDQAPAEDVMTATQLTFQLEDKGYDIPVGSVKLFSEVNAYVAEQKVVTAIYHDEAVIIVGSYSPAEYVIFAIDIQNILNGRGLTVNTILDTELESADLIDLFVTGPSCTSQGYKCTSAVRGCGHYDHVSSLDSTCGSTGVICCEEIPYCGDGVCFTHSTPGYGETPQSCPQDCGISCTESDNGKNYYQKGSACMGGLCKTDYCSNSNLVEYYLEEEGIIREGYCDPYTDIFSVTYNCPSGCSNGACLEEPSVQCTDSDGGKNYYKQGIVEINLPGLHGTSEDFCEGNGDLIEFMCPSDKNSGQADFDFYHCPYGCKNGACLEAPEEEITCTDSDGGKNYFVKGEVTGYSNQPPELFTFVDCCVDSEDPTGKCVSIGDTVVERYCEDGYWNSFVYKECPYGCKNGACLEEPEDDDEPLVLVREQVKCLFMGATEQEKCYSAEPHELSCRGTTSCKIDVVGREDNKITWKSSCGGYAYTRMDGIDEYIKFDCSDDEEIEVPTCTDGIWNDGETGVDCGGPCPPCVETRVTCKNGCLSDSTCLPFGTRRVDDNKNPVFCNLNREFDRQKQDGHICQNSYECLSNSCHNGVCISLEKELRETRGILESIFEWLRSLFG